MFDIVNREYEENGSFRCDFVATKERDRELDVYCGFAGFTPAQAAAQLAEGSLKHNKGIWWMPWRQEAMKDVALCDKLR